MTRAIANVAGSTANWTHTVFANNAPKRCRTFFRILKTMSEHQKLLRLIETNPNIFSLFDNNEKIAAIRELRCISGCGLKEGKEALEAWERGERPTGEKKLELDIVSAAWIVRNMIGQNIIVTDIEREALKKLSDEIIG